METQPLVDILGAAVPRPPPEPTASPETTSNEKRGKYQSLKGHGEKTEIMPGSSPASPGTWIDPKKTLKKADAFTESENEAWKITELRTQQIPRVSCPSFLFRLVSDCVETSFLVSCTGGPQG